MDNRQLNRRYNAHGVAAWSPLFIESLVSILLFWSLLSFLPLHGSSGVAYAEFAWLEEAVEVASIEIIAKGKSHGTVIAKGCTHCPIKLPADHDILLFHGDHPLSTQEAKAYFTKPGVLFYDAKERKVTRIRWW